LIIFRHETGKIAAEGSAEFQSSHDLLLVESFLSATFGWFLVLNGRPIAIETLK
jgi:hypothetical protein